IGEAVRKPERQAIDDDDARGELEPAQMNGLFDRRECGRSIRAMALDALTVIVVVDARRGEIDWVRRKPEREAFGVAALAGARTAKNEHDARRQRAVEPKKVLQKVLLEDTARRSLAHELAG